MFMYWWGELGVNKDLAKWWVWPLTFWDIRIWNWDLAMRTVGNLKNFSGYSKYSIFNLQYSII